MFKLKCKSFLECMANTMEVLLLVAVITVAVAATGYAAFEDYLWYQNIEWAIQTVTSTGYGNYPAQTMAGSLWSSLVMSWGVIVILSLVVAVFVEAFRKDEHKLTDAEQDWSATALQAIAYKVGVTLPDYPDSNKEN